MPPCEALMPFSIPPLSRLPLTYVLGIGLLITLLLLSSGTVYAEWVLIGENDRGSTYVDPDTIRRQEDLVSIWQMLDEKAPDTIRGSSFLSIRAQIECDCAEERIRGLSISYHSGN